MCDVSGDVTGGLHVDLLIILQRLVVGLVLQAISEVHEGVAPELRVQLSLSLAPLKLVLAGVAEERRDVVAAGEGHYPQAVCQLPEIRVGAASAHSPYDREDILEDILQDL